MEKLDYKKINEFRTLIGKVENRTLDDEQVNSIVKGDNSTLVIAGAGSGKTTTIVGKIKYLICKEHVSPNKVLVLSFTNLSAKEMKERIEKEINASIYVSTFHKLGLEIIKESTDYEVEIFTGDLRSIIITSINKLINNSEYLIKLISYLVNTLNIKKGIKDEIFKYKEETIVSYFLYLNNIMYEYTSNSFYLITYDLFIKCKKNFNLVKFILYLKSNNIILTKVNYNLVWKLFNKNNNIIYSLSEYFCTVISLIKSNDLSLEELERDNKDIIYLIKPIYEEYNKYLKDNNLIDFNDMINLSTYLVNTNKYIHNYDYVIVDEFQDISKSRYNLLIALRKQKDYKLFCVGDDFQSIYRFSGCDISLITEFEKYFGKTKINKITTTYRFPNLLAKISGEFIMKNKKQIKKEIKGIDSNIFPLEIINNSELENKLKSLPYYSTVYFLGRYSTDIDLIKGNKEFLINYRNNKIEIIYGKRVDLDIEFLTIHKSKGLERDYTFILNNKERGKSFPSKIINDKFINSLLDNSDTFPFAEERRLFYVAITRAKIKCFLLEEKENSSKFLKELYCLIKKYDIIKKK